MTLVKNLDMYKHAKLEFAELELLNQEVFSIKLGSRITLELPMAQELIGACNQMLNSERKFCGYIIDMSGAAFVTEDARNFITEVASHRGKVEALALVSNNHLGNIISTLLISYSDSETFPMKLFKTDADAKGWVSEKLAKAKTKLLKTA